MLRWSQLVYFSWQYIVDVAANHSAQFRLSSAWPHMPSACWLRFYHDLRPASTELKAHNRNVSSRLPRRGTGSIGVVLRAREGVGSSGRPRLQGSSSYVVVWPWSVGHRSSTYYPLPGTPPLPTALPSPHAGWLPWGKWIYTPENFSKFGLTCDI